MIDKIEELTKELTKELASFHQRMKDELAELIAELRSDRDKQPAEWPQVCDTYWCGAFVSGRAYSRTYADESVDHFLKAIGDMHRTKEEAEAYRAYRMNPRTVMRDRIQMFVDGYNGGMRGKYTISHGGSILKDVWALNPIAIKDSEGVALLLEKFGLSNILWACGGPGPGGE